MHCRVGEHRMNYINFKVGELTVSLHKMADQSESFQSNDCFDNVQAICLQQHHW